MFIYLIVNHITGKYYVGQHKGANLKQYLQKKFYYARTHRNGTSYLFASMRKHPNQSDWSIHALLSNIQTREELDQKEKEFIEFLRSRDPEYGYNICRGGEGFSGCHTPETKAKISAAAKDMWTKAEVRASFTAKMKGRPSNHTPEGKEAIRQAHLGRKVSPETIEKLRNSHIGHASPRRKCVRCVENGEVFPSLTAVVKQFGGCTTNLSRSIKQGHSYFGKRFEYV